MFQTLRNAWKITDLRKKILYTLLIVLIFRIGSAIVVPFVDVAALTEAVGNITSGNEANFMDFLTMISGGGFANASVFALSITPYINASIIIQLLTVAIPRWEELSKEEAGRKVLGKYTRIGTVLLGLLLGVAYYFMLRNNVNYDNVLVTEAQSGFGEWFAAFTIVFCFVAGSALIMWLGEQINERGIGNGISILLFAGILSSIPDAAGTLWSWFYHLGIAQLGQSPDAIKNIILVPVVLAIFLAMIALIVFITDAERRIPVQYAKRVVGRKMYGGQSTYIPIKVNMSGVMPIILASSIVSLPSIIATFFRLDTNWFFNLFKQDNWVYIILYFVLIIGFAFFYVTIQYNPTEMANNLRKNSGAIPGYRPGQPTSDYIKRVLNKVTLIGALFLGFIALFPSLFGKFSGFYGLTLGGTSVMIVVSVALETTQQIESQMMMRHYKGFLE